MVLLASSYDTSKFFKAADLLEAEKKLRVKTVTEELVGVGAEQQKKLVVWFTNDERGLVLNKTNNRTMRGAFGDACDGWAGKIVVLFPSTVDLRGKMVASLRVRISPPKQQATTTGNGATKVEPEQTPPAKPVASNIADDLNDEIPF